MSDGADVWLDSKALKMPGTVKKKPVYDTLVSDIVGRPVLVNDPRLIRYVIEWKKKSGNFAESDMADNMLENPQFLTGLKVALDG